MSKVITLKNVRLSFPALFRPAKGPDADSKPAYKAAFILDKKVNALEIAAINAEINDIVRESFKGKRPPKVCLRDGSEKSDTDGYGDGVMFLNARSATPPPVVDRDGVALREDSNKLFAGCYVYATIQLWAQDNQYGKRINAKLRAVQFYKEGKPFGEGQVDAARELPPITEDDEAVV